VPRVAIRDAEYRRAYKARKGLEYYYRDHAENLWQPEMSWENWSREGWHLDHKKPLCDFDLTNPEEFAEACHYSNYQPLWAIDNLRKNRHAYA
jgi:hypothetical protein